MRILYIDHHAAAPSAGGGCRALQLAQHWQQCGDEVTILTAGYSHRRGSNPTLQEDMTERRIDGVRFCYLNTPCYAHGVGEYRKSVQVFLKKLYLSAPRLVERYRPEIVIAASGYPYDFFCAQRMAKLARGKAVFELREVWPELQRELYPAEDSRLNSCIAEYAMDYALRGADTVVSFLQKGEDYCRAKGTRVERMVTLPAPMPPQASAQPLKEADSAALTELQKRCGTVVAYAGHLTARRMPELLAETVGEFREQGVGAVIAGNGGYKLLLRRKIRENGWDNILLLDALSERRQRTLYGMTDLIYYGDNRLSEAPYGAYAPLLLRMMQNGKPLLLATNSAENDAEKADCAVSAASLTPQGLGEALKRFLEMSP